MTSTDSRRPLSALPLLWILASSLFFEPAANAQSFDDVSDDYWAAGFIEIVRNVGVTVGCGGNNYCPEDSITRAQMAVFLERGMRGYNYVPPPATGEIFNDVGADDFAADYIEQLYADGITGGCGGGNYCPGDPVTRDQMAVFLLRARYGAEYTPPPATGVFNDVPTDFWAAAWIEQLALEGITAGCGDGDYCPSEFVTRAQMAVFVVRALPAIVDRVIRADAGVDLISIPLAQVTLSAAASVGPIASYLWRQTSGPPVSVGSENSVDASVFVPAFSERQILEFELSVTADDGRRATDTVQITVNLPPTATAERDRRVRSFALVGLRGAGTDPDGSVASYQWQQVAGPSVNIQNANTANAEFVVPEVMATQVIVIELTVTDSDGFSSNDSVSVIADPPSAESLNVDLLDLEFLELKDANSHRDFGPISGDPTPGPTTVRISISGPAESATLVFRQPDGSEIGRSDLSVTNPYVSPQTFYAEVEVPATDFGVSVEGGLRSGGTFDLTWPDLIRTRDIRVSCDPELSTASGGVFLSGICTVANFGDASLFNIAVTDPNGLLSSLSANAIYVDTGSSTDFNYSIEVPLNIERFSMGKVGLAVSSDTDPSRVNETSVSVWMR